MHNNCPVSQGKIRTAKVCEGVCAGIKQMNKKEGIQNYNRKKFQTWETESDTEESIQLATSSGLGRF